MQIFFFVSTQFHNHFFFILLKSRDINFTKLIKFSKNLMEFADLFHKFFKLSSQTSFTLRKVAEHVSSFPSALGDHRLVIFVNE